MVSTITMAPNSKINAGKNTALSMVKRREVCWVISGSYIGRGQSVPEACQKTPESLV
jgi:hypothetical protein